MGVILRQLITLLRHLKDDYLLQRQLAKKELNYSVYRS